MSTEIATLQARLELQTEAFAAGVKQVDRRLKSMDKGFKKTSRSVISMEKGLGKLKGGLAGIAASMAAAFSVNTIKNSIEFADSIAKTSKTLGLSVESFQKFTYASELAGISSSQFSSNMTAFVKRVGEAQAGVGPLVSGLQKMDGALLKSVKSAKSQEEAFGLVLDAMNNAGSAAEKARIANAAFSRSGVAMSRMAENYKSASDEAERLGLVMSGDTAKSAEVMNDMITRMTTQIKVKFTSAIVTATAKTLEFFDIFTNEGRLQQQIDATMGDLQQSVELYARIFERQDGKGMDAYQMEIDRLSAKLVDLNGQLKQFEKDPVGESIGNGLDQAGEKYASLARKVGDTLDPLAKYKREIEELKLAVVAGEISSEDAGAYIAEMAKKIAAAEPDVISFAQEMENLGASIRATTSNAVADFEQMGMAWSTMSEGDFDFGNLLPDMTGMDDELSSITAAMNAQKVAGEALGSMWEEYVEGPVTKVQTTSELMLTGFTDSFEAFTNGVAQGTAKIGDLFKNMVSSLIAQFLRLMAYKGIMAMLGGPGTALGGAFGSQAGLLTASAKGNVFNHGMVKAFATGGIVGGPTTFPMSNGKTGLMGEAGPEAIMPLRRGPGGSLGVEAVQPVVNVTNNAPVSVQTRSSTTGSVEIEIVERAIESAIRRGGNGIANSIESVYGVNRGSGAFGY